MKDLCARLPYGVKLGFYASATKQTYICTLLGLEPQEDEPVIAKTENGSFYMLAGHVKPYLFPLSSMTEKQNDSWRDAWFPDLMTSTDINYPESEKYLVLSHAKSLQWLYKNHFDVNGLIPKGLAIDATGLNIY